jgi:hypothetical protein
MTFPGHKPFAVGAPSLTVVRLGVTRLLESRLKGSSDMRTEIRHLAPGKIVFLCGRERPQGSNDVVIGRLKSRYAAHDSLGFSSSLGGLGLLVYDSDSFKL